MKESPSKKVTKTSQPPLQGEFANYDHIETSDHNHYGAAGNDNRSGGDNHSKEEGKEEEEGEQGEGTDKKEEGAEEETGTEEVGEEDNTKPTDLEGHREDKV